MAFLYISEFSGISMAIGDSAPMTPPLVDQTPVAISATSAQSAAFNEATTFVIVSADEACSIAWGENPTATTNNMRVPPNVQLRFGVVAGQKVAAIQNT